MRIPNFTVQNQRAVRNAVCESVPPLMILTGPNGCGKSTLLNALRNTSGSGRTLYVGPHRTSRRQQVRMRFLGQNRIEMGELLSGPSLPGFEGINLPSHERDAWNFDEAQSFLKYSLCQIELDRQAAIAQRYDEHGVVSKEGMPDVWRPLRQMTHNLLPHLEFHRIDVTNRDQIRCLWSVHSKELHVDIDDLSSGEKAIIQLFFPLVEHHVNESIKKIKGTSTEMGPRDVAVLMDEPELHLHPNLQGKVLDYVRSLALGEGIQFILATHSPTIVEQATSEELYLLRPSELVPAGENQLTRIASDEEKLIALREAFGTTSNITAMRKVLVVEGRAADKDSRRPSDARIYGFLNNHFGQLTVVAGGGKSECKLLVQSLNATLKQLAPNLVATAVLDRDIEEQEAGSSADVIMLPVSMIENLLVDPAVIWNAIQTVTHKTPLADETAVVQALDSILDELEGHEVARRVKASIPPTTFRLRDPVSEAKKQVQEFTESLFGALSEDRIAELQINAREAVKKLISDKKRREHFDGKRILDLFFKRHLHDTGMSKEIFVYECARQASKRQSVTRFSDALFAALGIEIGSTAPQSTANPKAQPGASPP